MMGFGANVPAGPWANAPASWISLLIFIGKYNMEIVVWPLFGQATPFHAVFGEADGTP
jgi:hypothetical protein